MSSWFSLRVIIICAIAAKKVAATAQFTVTKLTTEYLDSPLGVDSSNPRVSWHVSLSNTLTPRRGVIQTSFHIEVSDSSGFNSSVWDCGRVFSDQAKLVPLSDVCDNLRLKSDTHYFWRVTVTLDDGSKSTGYSKFHTGLISKDEWKAKWITGGKVKTLLRSEFSAPKLQSHATLFVSGIGYHEIYMNGKKVGNHQLDPGWTDYTSRVWYSTHDISHSLLEGCNVVGAMLGNGWWSCGPGTGMPNCSNSPPQLLLQLHVDGKPVLITDADSSDPHTNWKVASGPVLYNSLYHGEVFDGRIAEKIEGWTSEGFDSSDWIHATKADSVANNASLSSQLFEPIRHISSRGPIGSTSPASGVSVFDFGQNQAAVVHLKHIICDCGQKITLRHAELLKHPPYGPRDGNIYVENLRGALATDVYICRGDPNGESYIPTFTQHGFRYVEVSGLRYPLNEENIEAVELHSDVQQTSSILFSSALLNKIQHAVVWGQKSNLMSVPTDCNQRDERKGWMGDAALTGEEAAYNFGMGAFYSRWLMQIVDSQDDEGSVPNYVPPLDAHNSPGAPNWESGFPTVLHTLYTYYGDVDVAFRYHNPLKKYFQFFERKYNKSGIKAFMQGFGDWVPPPPHPKADGHLVGAFAFLHDLQLGAELFASSSHPDAPEQARHCFHLIKRLSKEYHEAFYNKTEGVYKSGLQTEQALPLFLGVVPTSLQQSVISYLIKNIQETNSGHTTCGIVGIKFLMEVLTILGHSDVALDLALQTTYPSWGFMINNPDEPATTVWELWNGNQAGPGMNSRNHIMFGSISSWFYKYLAGITPAEPGYSLVSIKPTATGHSNLTHIDARVATPHGDIHSHWKLDNHNGSVAFTHVLYLPPNTKGTLAVPVVLDARWGTPESENIVIRESGVTVWANGAFVPGVLGILSGKKVGSAIEFYLDNGRYMFVASTTLHHHQITRPA